MSFYSYDYFLNQSQTNYYLRYAVILVLLVALFFVTIKQLKSTEKIKYRDLIVIILMTIVLIGGIQLTEYNTGQTNRNNSSQMLLFLKTAGKNLHTDKEKIAVNSTSLQDKMVVKVKNDYYQISFNSDLSSYRIEEAYLVNDNVTVNE